MISKGQLHAKIDKESRTVKFVEDSDMLPELVYESESEAEAGGNRPAGDESEERRFGIKMQV